MEHENEPLIPFLTGAGGSGKSEVINNFLQYAKGFCQQLGQPFGRWTIVVTALTTSKTFLKVLHYIFWQE
jgi:hypothetical protein